MGDYRDDDQATGYCPTCGQQCVNVGVGGGGWCPDHGKVFVDWEPPEDALWSHELLDFEEDDDDDDR